MIIDKDNIKILLVLLIVGLGLGYAYINSDLNINGTAQVRSANWDVHWANIQVSTGSVSASTPTISNQTTVNYSVTLPTPGSYYEFTVDAVNAGSIDAMIDTISSKLNGTTITTLPAYLKYSVTYEDGEELEQNHELLHNTTEKYKVRIEYNTEVNQNQLPTTNQTLNLQFTVTYRQANENAQAVRTYLYRSNGNYVYLGNPISSLGTTYTTPEDVVNNTNRNVFVRHKINNNLVSNASAGFFYNNNFYYLKAGGATKISANTYNEDSIYYEQNKAVLQNAFGNNNCVEDSDMISLYSACSNNELVVLAYKNGRIIATDDYWECLIFEDEDSDCSYNGVS